jgi:hypothetical protein
MDLKGEGRGREERKRREDSKDEHRNTLNRIYNL